MPSAAVPVLALSDLLLVLAAVAALVTVLRARIRQILATVPRLIYALLGALTAAAWHRFGLDAQFVVTLWGCGLLSGYALGIQIARWREAAAVAHQAGHDAALDELTMVCRALGVAGPPRRPGDAPPGQARPATPADRH
jgi:hypothetical protein